MEGGCPSPSYCSRINCTSFFLSNIYLSFGLPRCTSGRGPTCHCRAHLAMWVQSLGQKDLLEEGPATHSSILAWRIPWTEEPGGLQSIELQRVRHNQSNGRLQSMELQRVRHNQSDFTHTHLFICPQRVLVAERGI